MLQVNMTAPNMKEYPLHVHSRYEIMLYLEGTGVLQTPEKSISFAPGSVIIVPPGIMHGSRAKEGFRNISIEGDFNRFLHISDITHVKDNSTGEGARLAILIYENRHTDSPYLDALSSAYLHFLTSRLTVKDTLHRAVEDIVAAISHHALDAEFSLRETLAASGFSEDYVRARFKEITGKTPTEFLTDLRMKHASYLIGVYGGKLSLSEIAEQCGYLDYAYFSRCFKKKTGHAPREHATL